MAWVQARLMVTFSSNVSKSSKLTRSLGLGDTWWAAWATNSSVARPILFGTDGLHGATISGLKLINPPNWFNFISNSSEVIISDMNLSAISKNASVAVKVGTTVPN